MTLNHTGPLSSDLALVTGAGRGNGRAIALGLAKAGAKVVVTDIDLALAEETCHEILATGAEALALTFDVADPAGCIGAAQAVASKLGPISILVNNAGILLFGKMDEDGARERWTRTRKVNIDGPYNVVEAFIGQLKATRGAIVNVASIQSFVGAGNAVAYAASKGALAQLTRALAVELARHDVRVNAIAPGLIDTAMTARVQESEKHMKNLLTHVPMRRIGRPEELVGAVVFLASKQASYITGAILPIDGGYLAV